MAMIRRLLIANRGEIAVRVARAAAKLGIETVAAVSDADRESLITTLADRVVCIGAAPARASYLNAAAVVAAAVGTGADAVHPGYGFLSEDPDLSDLCARNGVTFVGPPGEVMRAVGNKLRARELAGQVDVPVSPGSVRVSSAADARGLADELGYPLLIKAAAGGGGRGMRILRSARDLDEQLGLASAEAQAAFGDGTVYVERFVEDARHVEVQLLADKNGHVVHLADRDCSIQRRYQKIIEEAPVTAVGEQTRADILAAALRIGRAAGYQNAGTAEFLVDMRTGDYYFLEVNARVQVEHPVTEVVTGVDVVEQQLRIAAGEVLDFGQGDVVTTGHAIEARINAETVPDFRPSPGLITQWDVPASADVRVDTHCFTGYRVPPYYDSLLAKVIGSGPSRPDAITALRSGLKNAAIGGIDHTTPLILELLGSRDFMSNEFNTTWFARWSSGEGAAREDQNGQRTAPPQRCGESEDRG
ncbi:MAG: ATP-grasp domain-containing protein [Nocardiopsaceae bacterium]|nr:ATP-grasp domain-containing protein [Nocardiopsaceae bacterium]